MAFQESNIFEDLGPGNYTVRVRDANGVITTKTGITVGVGVDILEFSCVVVNESEIGEADGSITVNAINGIPPYQYKIGAGSYGSGNVFSNLAPGTYSISVKDSNDVVINNPSVAVEEGIPRINIVSASKTDETVYGANNGTITIVAEDGAAPYTYSIDGTNYYSNGGVFTGLAPASYTVYVKDALNKIDSQSGIVVGIGVRITSVTYTDETVYGASDGTITITASNGHTPYTYSKDGTNYFSNGGVFTGLVPSSYTVYVKDANNNVVSQSSVVIGIGVRLVSATPTAETIYGANDGAIAIVASNGISPYTYSKDGTNYFSNGGNFTGVAPATYTVYVKDANNHIVSLAGVVVSIGEPVAPVASSATNITDVSISANWAAATGATKYYLDVATDSGFTAMVSGFNNKDVGNNITYSVTGLTANTTYYFRVRAFNAGGTSTNSNTISQMTNDANAQLLFDAGPITDATQKAAVNFLMRASKGLDLTYNATGANIYAKQYADYAFVGGTAATHKLNAMNPQDNDAAKRITWGGGLTHNANGTTGNNVSGNGDTHITAANLGQNTAGYAIYIGGPAGGSTKPVFRTVGGTVVVECYPRYSGLDRCYCAINSTSQNISPVTDGLGSRIATRFGALVGNINLFLRGVKTVIGNVSQTPTNYNIVLFSNNVDGTLSGASDHNVRRLTFFNQSLTDTEVAAWEAINTQYQTMLSRNV